MVRRVGWMAALVLTACSVVVAQKAALTFRGTVEKVDAAAGRITVAGEAVEGWMAAMTMAYPVVNKDVLATLKAGDVVTAKVFAGDMALHDLAVLVAQKAALTFRGKVEKVDAAAGRITVAGEAVEGWMAAMTMAYPVTNKEVLSTLKVGDAITAKVFAGDMALHDVAVVAAQKAALTFRGKVERVDAAAGRITVAGEAVEGWMAAMTMAYPMANKEVLATLQVGDAITAKVFAGDMALHDVAVVGGVNQGPLGLAKLEQLALRNNPTAAQTQANMRAAAALAKQAGLYPNPTVGYYGDEIRGGYTGGGKQGGFVSQTIVMGGKLQAARKVAELQAAEAGASAEVQKARIVNGVRSAFYRVLAAQRLVEVRRKLQQLAEETTVTSRQLANIGQADRPDVLQAEVEQQQAAIGVQVAEQNLTAAFRVLAAVVGQPELPVTPLDGDLDAVPQLEYAQMVAETLRESPEVALAKAGVNRAEASLTAAKKMPIPDLQITGTLANNFEPLESTRRPLGLQGGAQVGVQLPLFNRNQGNIAAARDGIEVSRQEEARVRLQVQRDLAGMFREYDAARVIALQYKNQMLPRAEEAYHLYQASYRKMAAAYPQVLMSQRTLFQLEVEYVQALESAWQSAVAIRGYGLLDGLASPMRSGTQ